MGTEIERKFAVATPPYLAVGEDEVRLRGKGRRYLLTVKQGRGLTRRELEVDIAAEQFEVLWPGTEGRRVEKTRYALPLGELTAEYDVFEGALAGLRLVEVEFPDEGAARAFQPPTWFGRELTGQPGWSNAEMAQHGRPPG